jgi:hypothetical protein
VGRFIFVLLPLQEIIGLIFMPLLLLRVLPRNAAAMIEFVNQNTAILPDLGPVYVHSTFDQDQFGTFLFSFFSNFIYWLMT